MLMTIVARLFTWVFLRLGLLVFFAALVISSVLQDPDTYSSTLKEANVYEELVPALLEDFTKDIDERNSSEAGVGSTDSEDDDAGLVSINDPEIRNIFVESITPEYLERQVGGVLESFFEWADGDVDELEFAVDVSEVKQSVVTNVTEYAVDKIDSLPSCGPGDIVDESNLLDAECKPPEFTASVIESKLGDTLGELSIFDNDVITQNTFAQDDGAKLTDDISKFPNVFAAIKTTVYVSGGFVLVLIVLYLLARKPWRSGLFKLGKLLSRTGVSWLVLLLVTKLATPALTSSMSSEGAVGGVGAKVIEQLVSKVIGFSFSIAAAVTVAGLVLVIIGYRRKSKHPK